MAKVLVSNHRDHAIHINVPGTATDLKGKPYVPQEVVLIPPAKGAGEDRKPGTQWVESEHLEVAKQHPVVQHYFREGWLRVAEEKKEKKGKEQE